MRHAVRAGIQIFRGSVDAQVGGNTIPVLALQDCVVDVVVNSINDNNRVCSVVGAGDLLRLQGGVGTVRHGF